MADEASATRNATLYLYPSQATSIAWRGTLEIARTQKERNRGLMGRKSLPQNRGMLFVYPRAQPLTFWMRNTLVDLALVGLDARCRVTKLRHLHAHDERIVSAGYGVAAIEIPWEKRLEILTSQAVTGMVHFDASEPLPQPSCFLGNHRP